MDVLMPFNPDCEPAPPLREPASFLQSPLPPMPITIGPDQAIAHAGWTSALSTVLAETLAGPCLVEVVGPAGTGKTLLLEAVARMLRDGGVDEHLHMRGDSGLLNKGAVAEAARRNRVVLIDEADRVGPEVLRSIRGGASGGCAWVLASKTVPLMLPAARALGAQTPGAQTPGAQTPGPLASGLLASGLLASGADDAASRAAAPRITVVRLAPLPAAETRAFVDARLARIGLSGRLLTDAAVAELARCSGGVPRVVNMLLGAALFLAHSEAAPAVDREHVEGAAALRNLDAVVEAGRPGPPHAQGPLHALAANTAAFSSGLPSRPADPVRPVDLVRPVGSSVRPAKADVRSVPDPLAADLQLASLPATGQPSISQPSTEQPVVKAEPVADEALVPAADPAAPAGSDAPVQPDASARTEASGEPDAAVGPAAHAASGPAAHAATGTAASPDPAMRPGVASAHDPAPPAAIDAPLDASPWMCAPAAQGPGRAGPGGRGGGRGGGRQQPCRTCAPDRSPSGATRSRVGRSGNGRLAGSAIAPGSLRSAGRDDAARCRAHGTPADRDRADRDRAGSRGALRRHAPPCRAGRGSGGGAGRAGGRAAFGHHARTRAVERAVGGTDARLPVGPDRDVALRAGAAGCGSGLRGGGERGRRCGLGHAEARGRRAAGARPARRHDAAQQRYPQRDAFGRLTRGNGTWGIETGRASGRTARPAG